jgi:hypothetical protein
MVKERRIRYIVLGEGNECQKCGKVMQRRGHKEIPRKTYYFKKWDICLNPNCKMKVQHYEEFKSSAWSEAENQENFFRNIT